MGGGGQWGQKLLLFILVFWCRSGTPGPARLAQRGVGRHQGERREGQREARPMPGPRRLGAGTCPRDPDNACCVDENSFFFIIFRDKIRMAPPLGGERGGNRGNFYSGNRGNYRKKIDVVGVGSGVK